LRHFSNVFFAEKNLGWYKSFSRFCSFFRALQLNSDPTIEQIIQGMPSRFRPEAARGLDAILQFRLSGDDGADFFATIQNEACSLDRGIHENPTLTLKMSAQTYVDMVMGRMTGQEAFFKRKLRYEGPISLAIKLHQFFAPPQFS